MHEALLYGLMDREQRHQLLEQPLSVLTTGATGLWRDGGLAAAAGIVVSFLATALALTVVLGWIYRIVGPRRPGPVATSGGVLHRR